MCKYCKLSEVNDNEKWCDNVIGETKDRSIMFSISINRYTLKSENINRAVIMMSEDVTPSYEKSYINVKTKSIPIKYCPFCGEKL